MRGFVLRERLLADGETVIVAFSGGADSTALLAILAALARGRGPRVRPVAAHLDHGLRRGSRGDATAARAVAATLGLPWVGGRTTVRRLPGDSIESAARRARYGFLARVARDRGAARVALAHHRDDRVETVLHRVLQGGTLAGLAGIPLRRPLPQSGGAEVVRPLWERSRGELRAYLAERGLPHREDPSNGEDGNVRARLRATVLPAVLAAFPHAPEGILAVERAAREALEGTPGAAPAPPDGGAPTTAPRSHLAALPPEGVRRWLRGALRDLGAGPSDPPGAAVRRLRDAARRGEDGRGRIVPVGAGVEVLVSGGAARLRRSPAGSGTADGSGAAADGPGGSDPAGPDRGG